MSLKELERSFREIEDLSGMLKAETQSHKRYVLLERIQELIAQIDLNLVDLNRMDDRID